MKLRSKKTGEIKDFALVVANGNVDDITLTELNENWEDYEEPKESYYIDCDGKIYEPVRLNESDLDNMASIGNCFETKEEVDKAVEKLKAWKRLKDAGFKFKGYEGMWCGTDDGVCGGEGKIDFAIPENFVPKDLNLLFGGEES